MLWELKWGDKLEFLEGLEEQGKSPPSLNNKPELPSYLSFYLESFNRLSSRRPVGSVEGAIPLSEIFGFLKEYPWYDSDLFVRLIVILDDAYLEFRRPDDSKTVNFRSSN